MAALSQKQTPQLVASKTKVGEKDRSQDEAITPPFLKRSSRSETRQLNRGSSIHEDGNCVNTTMLGSLMQCGSPREKSASPCDSPRGKSDSPLTIAHMSSLSERIERMAAVMHLANERHVGNYDEFKDGFRKFQEEEALQRKLIQDSIDISFASFFDNLDGKLHAMESSLHEQQQQHIRSISQILDHGFRSLAGSHSSINESGAELQPQSAQRHVAVQTLEGKVSQMPAQPAPTIALAPLPQQQLDPKILDIQTIVPDIVGTDEENEIAAKNCHEATSITPAVFQEANVNDQLDKTLSKYNMRCSRMTLRDNFSARDASAWKVVLGCGGALDFDLRKIGGFGTSGGTPDQGLTRLFYSAGFNSTSLVVNLVNSITVGLEENRRLIYSLQQAAFNEGRGPKPDNLDIGVFESMNAFFCVWIFIEILLALFVLRKKYFTDPDLGWRIFDVFIFLAAIVSLMQATNLTYIRIFRVFRMIRIFRIVRVFKFVAGLRRMIISIVGGTTQLMWAFLLLALINYIFSVFICEQISQNIFTGDARRRLQTQSDTDAMPEVEVEQRLLHVLSNTDTMTTSQALESRYGNLARCMFTLLLSISGGDWGDLARPLADLRSYLTYFYSLYIAIMIFGVLNILTGTFVESAIQAAARDRDNAIETAIEQKDSDVNKLRAIFVESDVDGSGQVSFHEFEDHLQNEEVAAYLHSMGLDMTSARGLYQLIDVHNANSVNIDDLVAGCMRLKGQAQAVDLATLMLESKKMMKTHAHFAEYCCAQFTWLEHSIQRIADSTLALNQNIGKST